MHYNLAESTWGEEEINAMRRVIDSDRLTMGEEVKQFESAFAQKFGAQYAIMTSSGSSANLVGLASLFFKKENPLKPGDEVIVPSISWATTYYPLQQYGLKLKFLDVELNTLNMDASKLEEALTQKTKMVPCIVTRARYLSGFKPPASFNHPPGSKLYKTEASPGLAN